MGLGFKLQWLSLEQEARAWKMIEVLYVYVCSMSISLSDMMGGIPMILFVSDNYTCTIITWVNKNTQFTHQLQLNPVDHRACAECEGGDARYNDEAVEQHGQVNASSS